MHSDFFNFHSFQPHGVGCKALVNDCVLDARVVIINNSLESTFNLRDMMSYQPALAERLIQIQLPLLQTN